MPAKKHVITDEERAKRLRETAREIGTSNSPEDFERALAKVVTRPKGIISKRPTESSR